WRSQCFFQAEDGIRDFHVTGVQTCALPISRILDVKYFILLPHPDDIGTPLDIVQWSALLRSASALEMYRKSKGRILPAHVAEFRSEERRVGEGSGPAWSLFRQHTKRTDELD